MPFDPSAVTGFQWDAGNLAKSAAKHAVSVEEAEQVFRNRPVVAEDETHSRTEPRYRALGETDARRLLHVTFTIRGTLIRVISARPMSRKERALYVSKT
jgi:hypothetical protein